MISNTQLKEASIIGEERAAKALSILSKNNVSVKTRESKMVNESDAITSVNNIEGHAIISYSRILTGFEGICILSLTRENALDLVDLFNNRPRGTTVTMQEIDRSTIRETLNILSNSYITEVAKIANKTVLIGVPYLVTKEGLEKIISESKLLLNRQAALFQTDITIQDVDFNLVLYFFFITEA